MSDVAVSAFLAGAPDLWQSEYVGKFRLPHALDMDKFMGLAVEVRLSHKGASVIHGNIRYEVLHGGKNTGLITVRSEGERCKEDAEVSYAYIRPLMEQCSAGAVDFTIPQRELFSRAVTALKKQPDADPVLVQAEAGSLNTAVRRPIPRAVAVAMRDVHEAKKQKI